MWRLPIDTLALIPARGGSKGLPGKNLTQVGVLSLVALAITIAKPVVEVLRERSVEADSAADLALACALASLDEANGELP